MNQTPNARGYDYFFGFLGGAIDSYGKDLGLLCGSAANNYTEVFADDCKFLNAYDFQENGVPYNNTKDYANNILTDKAIEVILQHDAQQPFLMHYHTNVPHTPLTAEKELYELCQGVSVDTEAYQPYFRQVVCAMVTSFDIDLLRLLMGLGLQGMLPSTLIQFSSDNGGLTQAGSVNLPYRGEKGGLFEGGIRVPSFMFGNGLHLSHRLNPERSDLITSPDILPTMIGYAGLEFSFIDSLTTFDGYNMWPTLKVGLPLPRQSIAVVSATKVVGLFSAYIQKYKGSTYKYLLNPSVLTFVATSNFGETYQAEGEFLFNLSDDPYETTNLKDDHSYFLLLNYMRARTLLMQLQSSQTSQITALPPPIDLPPSPYGCWLPLDSPLYYTFVCPGGENYGNYTLGWFEVGEVFDPSIMFDTSFSPQGYGSADKYTQYVTSNLCL
jgi:arylsulfatase A-like enzyme